MREAGMSEQETAALVAQMRETGYAAVLVGQVAVTLRSFLHHATVPESCVLVIGRDDDDFHARLMLTREQRHRLGAILRFDLEDEA
jgi:hypothetical protein